MRDIIVVFDKVKCTSGDNSKKMLKSEGNIRYFEVYSLIWPKIRKFNPQGKAK